MQILNELIFVSRIQLGPIHELSGIGHCPCTSFNILDPPVSLSFLHFASMPFHFNKRRFSGDERWCINGHCVRGVRVNAGFSPHYSSLSPRGVTLTIKNNTRIVTTSLYCKAQTHRTQRIVRMRDALRFPAQRKFEKESFLKLKRIPFHTILKIKQEKQEKVFLIIMHFKIGCIPRCGNGSDTTSDTSSLSSFGETNNNSKHNSTQQHPIPSASNRRQIICNHRSVSLVN